MSNYFFDLISFCRVEQFDECRYIDAERDQIFGACLRYGFYTAAFIVNHDEYS